MRDFCREHDCEELAKEFDAYTLNKGMMADPEVDKFKVWPTQADRGQFTDVIGLGSRAAIENKHPLVRRKYARQPDPRPRMVEAYLLFSDEIREFFLGTEQQPPVASDQPLAARIDECFQALKNALHVAVIDLEHGDDAQVIFETLNARGEPLLPADLLRNYIFLRAGRHNEPQEELYHKYWSAFDEDFWRTTVRQGRLTRPRSDLYMQHFLASRQMVDIPVKHLYVEYRFWIEREQPFKTVREELAALAKQGEGFRRLLEPVKGDIVYGLAVFLNDFDISTVFPLLLYLFDAGLSTSEWSMVSTSLESYLVRRAVLGWTTKSYNKIFLNLIKALRQTAPTPQALTTFLSRLQGESAEWPKDAVFAEAWKSRPLYEVLNNAKLVHILRRLNDTYLGSKNELITVDGPLTVEHILPQNWLGNWPLANGDKGLNAEEMWSADADHPRVIATRARHGAVQTIGNLTILTQALNSSVSNSAWSTKKPELLKASLLPINQQLHGYEEWNEQTIEKRSAELFTRACRLWPGPSAEAEA